MSLFLFAVNHNLNGKFGWIVKLERADQNRAKWAKGIDPYVISMV